mgnify:FL=1
MFTGIVTDVGKVLNITGSEDLEVTIGCDFRNEDLIIGSSIAHDGICLTLFEKGNADGQTWYKVSISNETILNTYLSDPNGQWKAGSIVNLERSLRVGNELGGHIVTGHVDGVAKIVKIETIGESTKVSLEAPSELAQFIARKGSVTLNGTSLTVNKVKNTIFDVNLIPHTKSVTTWNLVQIHDKINLEIDILARYVARLNEMKR